MKRQIFFLSVLLVMLLASCVLSTRKAEEQKEEKISVLRYDKLLGEYVRSNSFSALQKLTMDYHQPTKILIEDVLSIGSVDDDTISQRLKEYYSDTTLLRLLDDVELKFPNLDKVEKGLTAGFKKLKKEVPDTKVPFIYAQVSAFNESIVVVDTLLGISLDKYMGEDYPLYKRFYYDYQCTSMSPERIVPDCFAFYLLSRYGSESHEGSCLVDLMMRTGKINYVVQHLLNYKDIGEAMGYTQAESNWCKSHEKDLWQYINSNDDLYAHDPMVIRNYMKLTPGMELLGEHAPALIGTWIGGQIITSYMNKHKEVGIKELLEMTDYHAMLKDSGYMKS